MLAVFIKFIELQNVLHQQAPVSYDALSACDFSSGRGIENLFQDNADSIFDHLSPYLTSEEKQLFSTFKNIKEMMSMADMFMASAIGREMILRKLLSKAIFDKYDYIIIDCLPSLGILVVNALVAANGVLIPVQTQKFALNGIIQFEEIIAMAKELNPTLSVYGVIETMCDNTNMTKGVDEALRSRYGDLVFESRISKSVMASNSTAEQKAMTINTKLGGQYAELTRELIERCK